MIAAVTIASDVLPRATNARMSSQFRRVVLCSWVGDLSCNALGFVVRLLNVQPLRWPFLLSSGRHRHLNSGFRVQSDIRWMNPGSSTRARPPLPTGFIDPCLPTGVKACPPVRLDSQDCFEKRWVSPQCTTPAYESSLSTYKRRHGWASARKIKPTQAT